MTTQVPPGAAPADHPQFTAGNAQYPPPAYSTAPPWAAPTAPVPPAPASGAPAPQHGGLLVRFPDEMRNVSRAQPPAVWPVAVFTLFFGALAVFSAKRRADQARRGRNSTAPYWWTYLVTGAAGAFLWFVVAAVVVIPAIGGIQENNRLEAVQRNVVGDGQLDRARIDATAATCRAVHERDAAGMRTYLCRLTLGNGKTASLSVTADTDGQWRSLPTG